MNARARELLDLVGRLQGRVALLELREEHRRDFWLGFWLVIVCVVVGALVIGALGVVVYWGLAGWPT